MSWGLIEKGGEVLVMRREDALDAGLPGPLTEELLLVVSVEGEQGQALQCSRARLAEILRCLDPKQVQMFQPDPQMEAAVRAGTRGSRGANQNSLDYSLRSAT